MNGSTFSATDVSGPGSAPRSTLGAIGRRARAANLSRAYEIQATLIRVAAGQPVSQAGFDAAIRAAHQIVGSAGTFGMAEASAVAHQLEVLLARADLRDEAGLMLVLGALDALLHELTAESAPAEHGDARRPTPTSAGSMLIAVEDPALASRITGAARARGWDTRWATDLASATTELEWSAPDVVLLCLDPTTAATELLHVAAAHEPAIPVIVLLREDDVVDRVEASRAGAAWFAAATAEPGRIVAAAADAVSRPDPRRRHVLAVDDDPAILDFLREVLESASLDVTTLAEPLQLWERLDEIRPDLVLLDVEMPGVTGLELCRLLRRDARWSDLPVLVLTGTIHPSSVTTIFAAGADDYVAKPVLGPELVSRIRNRLDRVQLLRRLAETDPLTGIANRAAFETAYGDLRALAARMQQPLALAMLDLDRFRQINTDHGYAVGDEVILRLATLLRTSFHRGDVVGRWSGTEFAIAMPGLDRCDAVGRVAEILEAFRTATVGTGRDMPVHATFSAAVAQQDTDGHDLYAILQALGHTMGVAKAAGGDRVLPVGWTSRPPAAPPDVVHVTADAAFGVLLHRALRTRGLSGEHLGSVEEAMRRLSSAEAGRPRVVVVDDDPPRVEVVPALSRLSSSDVLDDSRVVVLTPRAHTPELEELRRDGVFDVLAKPVELAVLLRRINRAVVG